MAKSVCHGEAICNSSRTLPLPPQNDILGELNADFRRSKVELIHRFLQDQEELNQRFAEYELNSEEEDGKNDGEEEGKSKKSSEYSLEAMRQSQSRLGNILEDLEDVTLHVDEDNLSTVSAFHTSSRGSIPDLADLDNIICQNDPDKRLNRDGNGNAVGYGYFTDGLPPSSAGQHPSPVDDAPPVTSKKSSRRNAGTKKPKKFLTKKNIRPNTATGFRLQQSLVDSSMDDTMDGFPHQVENEPRSVYGQPQGYSLHSSLNIPNCRMRKVSSWLTDTQTSNSSLMSENPQRMPLHPLSGRSRDHGSGHMHPIPSSTSFSHDLSPYQNNDLSLISMDKSLSKSHKEKVLKNKKSHKGTRELLSVDLRPLSSSSSLQSGTSGNRLSRGSYVPDTRSMGVVSPDGHVGPSNKSNIGLEHKRGKRSIAVLKLPPLEGAVVNKTVAEHQTLVNSAAKGTSVPPATEFMAG